MSKRIVLLVLLVLILGYMMQVLYRYINDLCVSEFLQNHMKIGGVVLIVVVVYVVFKIVRNIYYIIKYGGCKAWW